MSKNFTCLDCVFYRDCLYQAMIYRKDFSSDLPACDKFYYESPDLKESKNERR